MECTAKAAPCGSMHCAIQVAAWNFHRTVEDLPAGRLDAIGRRARAVHHHILQPVGRHARHLRRLVEHPAGFTAVSAEEPVDAHRTHVVVLAFLPAEELLVKIEAGRVVGGRQFVPGELADLWIPVGWWRIGRGERREHGALRIRKDGEASDLGDVLRLNEHLRAQRLRQLDGLVGVRTRDIRQPVRRRARIRLRHDAADRRGPDRPHRVRHLAFPRLRSPAAYLGVEGLRLGGVRGHQVVPHEPSTCTHLGHAYPPLTETMIMYLVSHRPLSFCDGSPG